ncbi:MAG: hypothetical protein NC408_01545 [Candidatus Gastranaerophilales bacterium]|nr:hypothetical protein [Candidatus Gastranaerophilales bacterium]MCM1072197.1 hypothetical protein [Bacteroides sp.]
MTNIKFAKDRLNLEWGEITQEDILRRMHNKKSIDQIDEKELDLMLQDLI